MFARFEKLIDPFPPAPPETPPDGLIAFIWHYTRGIWPVVAAMTVLAALIGVSEALLYAFLGNIVDWLEASDKATFLDEQGATLALMALFVLVVLPGLMALNSMVVHQGLLGNFPMVVRWQAHRHLLGQSAQFFADEFAGRIATKLMQTALSVRESVMKVCDLLVYVTSFFVGTLVVAASADWRLMLPLVAWLVGYLTILTVFIPRLSRISERQADARSLMTGRIVDTYTNIATVKLFSHARREEGYARTGMTHFLGTVHHQMRLVTVLNATIYLLNSSLVVSIAAVAIWLWLTDAVGLGAIALGIGLVLRLGGFSYWIMWEVADLFEHIGTVEDGRRTLATVPTVVDRPDAGRLAVRAGEVRFEGIRFHYGRDGGVIDDLSLVVRPGEKVGLVGRSGAGKTTLMNLLLRLYDLEGGRIVIDGQDIAGVTQESLRATIGVVTQDTALLHRSVRENIAYGRPNATEAEIVEAARRANADTFICELADATGRTGYDAHVGERGVKLSGGQRQRIALARVFLKDAPILLLDEATSALDSEVELAIQESLYALMEGKTVIAIAHRLSTIAALDRLIVMDQGRIVEDGRHDALVAAGGLYARLWRHQSGGFISDTREGGVKTVGATAAA